MRKSQTGGRFLLLGPALRHKGANSRVDGGVWGVGPRPRWVDRRGLAWPRRQPGPHERVRLLAGVGWAAMPIPSPSGRRRPGLRAGA